jgi:hypothetical protein
MFDVGESLRRGFGLADDRMRQAQARVEAETLSKSGRGADAAMAAAAQAALFREALLSMLHARLEEVKAASK